MTDEKKMLYMYEALELRSEYDARIKTLKDCLPESKQNRDRFSFGRGEDGMFLLFCHPLQSAHQLFPLGLLATSMIQFPMVQPPESMSFNVEQLRRYCEQNENIRLAFLFGSSAKGLAGEDSDVDIAVYLRDEGKDDSIWMDIGRLVGREVDLVVLNTAPATLVSSIVKTGISLTVKDRSLYWNTYLAATMEAEDFNEFSRDYWEIYQRSASLVPEDRTRLVERIQFLETEFEEVKVFNSLMYKEYVEERAKRRNIERWAENVVNATIDIAKILLASERKEIPKTYEHALLNFGIMIGLDEKGAEKLASFARLRNILAHQYLDITYERLSFFIKDSPPLYAAVFAFVRAKLQ